MRKEKGSANLYLALIIAVITIIAIVAAATSKNTVKSFEKGTPQQVVQSYLKAITDGRNDLAANNFSAESRCTAEDIDRAYIEKNIQISLVKTDLDRKTAVVHISIQRDTSLFNDTMSDEEQSIRLVQEDGLWRIAGIPWPLYDCGVYKK